MGGMKLRRKIAVVMAAHNTREGDTYYAATRSSDFIVQYMPVFAEASGDTRWTTLYESTYRIINQMVDTYGTGILPDFIVKDSNGKFVRALANLLESENALNGSLPVETGTFESCLITYRNQLHRILRWSWFYERKYERLSGYRSGQVFRGISLELQSFRMPHFQYRIMPTTAPTTACKI